MRLPRTVRLPPFDAPLTAVKQVENNNSSSVNPQRGYPMLKAVRLAFAAAAFALFAACNSDPSGVATLVATATPRQIDARGTTSLLVVEARDTRGAPGTGQVTLIASAGFFSDGTKQTTLTLANGTAGIGYSCNSNTDALCSGPVKVDAAWNQLGYSLNLQVANGGSDGGTGT